jgi:hypothetical protein
MPAAKDKTVEPEKTDAPETPVVGEPGSAPAPSVTGPVLEDGPIGVHLGNVHHDPRNDAGQVSLGAHNVVGSRDAQEPGPISISTEPVEGSDVLVRVTQDVVQEFYPPGAYTPSERLIAAEGAILTKDQVAAIQTPPA